MNHRKEIHSCQPPIRRVAQQALLYAMLCTPLVGCNSFGNGKLVQQLQHENDRLLTEFRAERSKREEFEKQNRTLEARLSESEKLLARQSGASSRLSSLPSAVNIPPLKPLDSVGNSNSNEPEAGLGADGNGFRWQRRVN